jgi:t-SNARE complex subunit (syntaxin)
MNEIALLVDEQGENINVVTENVNQAGVNLVEANEELDEAIVQQKKARKKCCLIAVVLVIAVIVVLGVVFITQWNNKDEQKQ